MVSTGTRFLETSSSAAPLRTREGLLGARNRWIVPLAAVVAATGSLALVHLAVYLYVATYPYFAGEPLGADAFASVSAFFTDVFHRTVYAALCGLGSYAAVRYGLVDAPPPRPLRAYLLGALTAVLAAACFHVLIQLLYPPALLRDTALFGSLGLAAGVCGAALGWRALAGDHALRSSRAALDLSENPAQILDALTRQLAEPVLEAALWKPPRATPSDPPDHAPGLALWASRPGPDAPERPLAPPARLDVTPLIASGGPVPAIVDVRTLDERSASGWRARGVRGVLVAPLHAPDHDSRSVLVAVLTVGLGRPRAGRKAGRMIATLAPQAGRNLNYTNLVTERSRQDLREKLCTDIHDSVANCSISVDKLLAQAEDLAPDLPEAAKGALAKARENARQMHASSRNLMRELRADASDAALRDAIAAHIATWERRTGHRALLSVSGQERDLGTDPNVALLRVLKEGLTNADKHAGLPAGGPPVAVKVLFQHGLVRLIIEDGGSGHDPHAHTRAAEAPGAGGYGLGSLRRSLQGVGGTLLVETAPGAGTRLVATVPAPPVVPAPAPAGSPGAARSGLAPARRVAP